LSNDAGKSEDVYNDKFLPLVAERIIK